MYSYGDVVISKNGRFKDKLFVVLKCDGQFAYLADGKSRRLKNPKKKNIKHLEKVECINNMINNVPQYAVDASIRRNLKNLKGGS